MSPGFDSGLLEYTLLCFTALFAMINPFGIAPVFKPLTHGLTHLQARAIARRATLTAFIMLLFFALAGKALFDFFSVSVNSLKIVGGIIFFMLGQELLQAKLSKMKHDNIRLQENSEQLEEYSKDIAITPLAMPILCGPGAIANVIIFMHDGPTLSHKLGLILSMMAVLSLNYVGLIGASRLLHLLGDSGNKVVMRIMGLIVMVIAVEFFFSGLKPIAIDILTSSGLQNG